MSVRMPPDTGRPAASRLGVARSRTQTVSPPLKAEPDIHMARNASAKRRIMGLEGVSVIGVNEIGPVGIAREQGVGVKPCDSFSLGCDEDVGAAPVVRRYRW